jgi:hypothetical protein
MTDSFTTDRSTTPFRAMADSEKRFFPNGPAPSDADPSGNGPLGTEEKSDWPVRSRFRKKYMPYGVRICDETLEEIRRFEDCIVVTAAKSGKKAVDIETREGPLRAQWGDWIMENSEGRHYPIAHEEFRKTYEPVGNQPKDS